MTARKLMQLLETVPPDLPVRIEPEVISALKSKAKKKPQYLSTEKEDAADLALLRKRSKADRRLLDWDKVKKDLIRRHALRAQD